LGEKTALTPLGRPDADSVALPANPFCGTTTTVDFAAPPGSRLISPGATSRVYPCALMVR